jgi:hypothetical protein
MPSLCSKPASPSSPRPKGDLQTLVQVARHLEALFDERGIEFDLGEDRGVGMKVDGRPAAARRPELLQRRDRLALLEAHLPLRAVTFDSGD